MTNKYLEKVAFSLGRAALGGALLGGITGAVRGSKTTYDADGNAHQGSAFRGAVTGAVTGGVLGHLAGRLGSRTSPGGQPRLPTGPASPQIAMHAGNASMPRLPSSPPDMPYTPFRMRAMDKVANVYLEKIAHWSNYAMGGLAATGLAFGAADLHKKYKDHQTEKKGDPKYITYNGKKYSGVTKVPEEAFKQGNSHEVKYHY